MIEESDVPTINELSTLWVTTPEPKAKWEKDGTPGLIIGGPFDNKIELDAELLKNGFIRGHNMRWHEYKVHVRPDKSKFFLYAGSREKLNV